MKAIITIGITAFIVIIMLVIAIAGYVFFNADGEIVAKYHIHADTIIEYRYDEDKQIMEEILVDTPDSYYFVVDVGIGYRTIQVTLEEWDKHEQGETIKTKAHSFKPGEPFVSPD